MVKITELMSGSVKLYETDSPINGHIEVTRDLFGLSIKCDGLTQSGNLIETIWKKPLSKLQKQGFNPKSCLILGLGGGSTAKLINKYFPDSKITGVDLDPIMVDLGKKYLKLDSEMVDIKITDAHKFVEDSKTKFDLILVDVYQGRSVPEKFDSESFAKMIKKIVNSEGLAIFNRLYAGDTRPKAVKFLKKLEKVFGKVDPVYPLANVLFICRS